MSYNTTLTSLFRLILQRPRPLARLLGRDKRHHRYLHAGQLNDYLLRDINLTREELLRGR